MKKLITCFAFTLAITCCNAQWDILGGDSTTFAANSNFAHIDTAAGNIWQIGVPQKPFFDTAHSAPYAIMTDTINSYPINNLSRFTVQIADSNLYIGDAYIGFWHKYQMDSLKDGGWVEISVDSGGTWVNVINSFGLYSIGIYDNAYRNNFYNNDYSDTILGNIPAFTGTQNSWEYSFIRLNWGMGLMPIHSNTNNRSMIPYNLHKVMFRFNFKSDSIQTNKAGWIIDDIAIRIYDVGGGIDTYSLSNFNVEVFPNPVNEQGIIQAVSPTNSHDFTISIYNSIGQIIKTAALDRNNQYIIKTNELSSGIYFYSVRNKDGESKNGKIIIK